MPNSGDPHNKFITCSVCHREQGWPAQWIHHKHTDEWLCPTCTKIIQAERIAKLPDIPLIKVSLSFS